jgi:hypothetical protein
VKKEEKYPHGDRGKKRRGEEKGGQLFFFLKWKNEKIGVETLVY